MTTAHDLLPIVRSTVDRHDLLPSEACVVVAVSGGADSLSLLHLLTRLAPERGWRLVVASFDHGWRPESSAEAEATLAWAATFGWPTLLGRADAARRDEAGARRQRHEFLRQCAGEANAQRIALGHSADDRAETLLLNLLRGAGTHGLGAMPPRSGLLVRPLLDCSRAEIAAYAGAQRLPVVTDPTNEADNLRARVRHEVLPLLDSLRPGARATLARAAAQCDADRQALAAYGDLLLGRCRVSPEPRTLLDPERTACLDVTDWTALPRPERHLLLRAWLRAWRGSLDEVDANLIVALDALAAGRADARPLAWPRALGEAQAVRCGGRLVLGVWPPPRAPRIVFGAGKPSVALRPADYTVRNRRVGDLYQPAGRPRKPVGDWLAEQGVPAPLRDAVPLVVLGEQIVWLPGQKPAEGFADPDGPVLGVVF